MFRVACTNSCKLRPADSQAGETALRVAAPIFKEYSSACCSADLPTATITCKCQHVSAGLSLSKFGKATKSSIYMQE